MRHATLFGTGLGLGVLVSMLLSAPVAAAGVLAVEPPSGVPGQALMAQGSGFPAGQQITLSWDSKLLPETGSSDSSGAFEIVFDIPGDAVPGGHELRACIRGTCSLAPPFTVAVLLAPTPGPTARPTPTSNPSTAPTQPPATPPSTPAATPTPTFEPTPASSPTSTPDVTASPVAGASASDQLAGPTVVPSALPADPSAPGTVKVQFYWDSAVLAGLLTLAVVAAVAIGAKNEKWLKSSSGKIFVRRSFQIFTAGKDAPAKKATFFQWLTDGTHYPPKPKPAPAPPEPPSSVLIEHEATHTATPTLHKGLSTGSFDPPKPAPPEPPSSVTFEDEATHAGREPALDGVILQDQSLPSEPPSDAPKDVKLKGKNIQES